MNIPLFGAGAGMITGALVGKYIIYPQWQGRQTIEYAAGDARVELGITAGAAIIMAGVGWLAAPPIARKIKGANARAARRSNAVYYGS